MHRNLHLDKKIKSAGTTLYVLAAISVLYGFGYYYINKTFSNALGVLVSYLIVSILFLLLGLWSRKKPVASIISGMILYILLQLIAAMDNPRNLINGAIVKIIIISYLIKGD